MVNKKHDDEAQNDIDITNNTDELANDEPELIETEERCEDKIKILRIKLHEAEEKQRLYHDELQRAKADFLNAKRRLEDEKKRDKERSQEQVIERILPLCDSFVLAMHDSTTWEKADETWRRGIEGIYSQLKNFLQYYGVEEINPTGQLFNPQQHEALSIERTNDETSHNRITAVMQFGYKRTVGETVIIMRPARVVVAEYKEAN
jgi:molecular chaperone GrpE